MICIIEKKLRKIDELTSKQCIVCKRYFQSYIIVKGEVYCIKDWFKTSKKRK
jgi:hypothetical protein